MSTTEKPTNIKNKDTHTAVSTGFPVVEKYRGLCQYPITLVKKIGAVVPPPRRCGYIGAIKNRNNIPVLNKAHPNQDKWLTLLFIITPFVYY
ncbi:MAG: hypothetical protein JRF37_07770 [Deltaproteobacteria bacterium]|nr:hypothetical protein [Deltaproteobacteria bacterium]